MPDLASPNFSSFADDRWSEELGMLANVELLESSDELEVRREEYAMGSLYVRCGLDGDEKSERGYRLVLEVDDVLDLHFEDVKRCVMVIGSARRVVRGSLCSLLLPAFSWSARRARGIEVVL